MITKKKHTIFAAMSPKKSLRDLTGQAVGTHKHKLVFVAMSGGVDSSVAGFLLKQQGFNVIGVFMRGFNVDGCQEEDATDARRAAEHLGIPFYVWDFESEYRRYVVSYMVETYRAGITPNPDVMCNKEIKFGFFLNKAIEMGADFIATGHYVRLKRIVQSEKFKVKSNSSNQLSTFNFQLYTARDSAKDQSYFLWTLTQEQLKCCLFPIGDYTKPQVREIARKEGLPNAEKKDSQGICFLGKVSLREFLKEYIPEQPGDVVTMEGKKLGVHEGISFYTIGQRHGLGLGVKNKEMGIKGKTDTKAHYVAERNVKTNTIVVAEGSDNPALYRKEMELKGVNFVNPITLDSLQVSARVRYRQPLSTAYLKKTNDKWLLSFDKPQKFVAPGQSAVFYSDQGEMLGGGVIV